MMQEKNVYIQTASHVNNDQPVFNPQGSVYVQPHATYSNQNYNPQFNNSQQQIIIQQPIGIPDIRHDGKWRDSLCDCWNNLWPSCGCQMFVCHGAWLIGQISQKLNFMSFNSVVIPFVVLNIISWCLHRWKEKFAWTYWIPYFYVLIVQIFLRLHFVRYYNINENGTFIECLMSCCCFPCSTCQMARHLYGYSKKFDGDADKDLQDKYLPIQIV